VALPACGFYVAHASADAAAACIGIAIQIGLYFMSWLSIHRLCSIMFCSNKFRRFLAMAKCKHFAHLAYRKRW